MCIRMQSEQAHTALFLIQQIKTVTVQRFAISTRVPCIATHMERYSAFQRQTTLRSVAAVHRAVNRVLAHILTIVILKALILLRRYWLHQTERILQMILMEMRKCFLILPCGQGGSGSRVTQVLIQCTA